MFAVNLGGEGEIPGVINQQGPWVITDPRWRSSRGGKTFAHLVADGHVFLICPNFPLPFPDGSVDRVYTVGVPIDQLGFYGMGLLRSEIERILKPGGEWHNDDPRNPAPVIWVKP